MDVRQVLDSLGHSDAAGRRARRDVAVAWLPLVLFGALTLASVVLARPGPRCSRTGWSQPAHPWTDAMLTVLYGVALIASGIGLRTRRIRR